jgi:hypothetical protein
MNSHDRQILRLMRSAAKAPAPPPSALSWAGELHVLAEWRRARAAGESLNWLPLLHRAVAVACALAVVAAVGSLALTPSAPAMDELSSLNEVVNAADAWL